MVGTLPKEDPVVVSNWSKPEPDLAIVRGRAEDYINRDVIAADLALVVEIAESSLSADQEDMAQIYLLTRDSGVLDYQPC